MTMEMSIILEKMSFMNLWNPAGALVSPSGITSPSKDPQQVWNVVFPLVPNCNAHQVVHIPEINLCIDLCLVWASRRSLISGSGYWSFFETWLIPPKIAAEAKGPVLLPYEEDQCTMRGA